MAYKADVHLSLPIAEDVNGQTVHTGESIEKFPGDTITDAEFKKANQTAEQIKELEEAGAISKEGK
jgi:hypothetical protein